MTSEKTKDKVAIVTGASGTICSVMARDLAQSGARVALLGRTENKLQAVADRIREDGGEALVCVADTTCLDALRTARETIREAFGPGDILINGAGGNHMDAITAVTEFTPEELENPATKGFFNLDMDAFHRIIEINIMGTVKPCQVFGEDMVRRGRGTILNFASMNSYRPLTKVGAYGAAKAGVTNFTQWLAGYLAPAGVRVNAIAPGFFVNDRSRKLLYAPEGGYSARGAQVIRHTPMRRFGEAEELLGAMRWLLDEEAAGFVTGITVPVDGGFLASSGC